MAVPTSAHGRTTTAAAESPFQSMLDAAPDAMVGVARDGRIVMANAQVETLFGIPQGELIGRPVEVLVPDRVSEVHPVHRERYFSNPKARPMGAGLDLAGRRADGTGSPPRSACPGSRPTMA